MWSLRCLQTHCVCVYERLPWVTGKANKVPALKWRKHKGETGARVHVTKRTFLSNQHGNQIRVLSTRKCSTKHGFYLTGWTEEASDTGEQHSPAMFPLSDPLSILDKSFTRLFKIKPLKWESGWISSDDHYVLVQVISVCQMFITLSLTSQTSFGPYVYTDLYFKECSVRE